MTDDNIEDISSHPYFVHGDFPFVFIPATSATGFTFANNHPHIFRNDNQMTTEIIDEKEKENTIDDQNEENDNANVRISQPKYSQLLKDLDFSEARMYDVTKLLSDEAGYYLTADENDNQKKLSGDEKYQSLSSTSSSVSAKEPVNHQSSSNSEKNSSKIKQNENSNDIQNGLNHLAKIIQVASQISPEEYDSQQENGVHIDVDTHLRLNIEENDDTSKQATQNYDLDDKEKENIPSPYPPYKNSRFPTQNSHNTQDDNLSSIPRLNTRTENSNQSQEYHLDWNDLINGTDGFSQSPTVVIFAQSIDDIHTTPNKQQRLSTPDEKSKQYVNSSPKQKARQRSRQLSSDTDSTSEYAVHPTKTKSQQELVIDEDLKHDRTTSASEILLRRLSNQQTSPNKKKSHHHRTPSNEDHIQSKTNDTWLSMFEKLEREHKERLDKQQKQYEEYMRNLEEKMKQRFEEYLSSTNSLKESKSESLDSAPIDSNVERCRTSPQYRPLAKDLNNHYYSTADKRQSIGTNLLRSQSREDISTLRTELLTKHAKHISDLKLYYEHEIDELRNQVNSSKMGHTSSTTRHSLETIERINNENNLLHDEIKELRHSLKSTTDENTSLKRQVEEFREQLNRKDLELKSHRRTMTDLDKQLNEARDVKERQDEKMRHADRQALFYKQENEKITSEFNLTRERLIRMEERYRDLENGNKTFRQQGFANENNNQRINDNHTVNSAMPLNMPTSREYGRFTLSTSRYSSSTTSSPRNGNLDSGRYTSNDSDNLFRHGNSPRPLLTISDYLNEKPTFPPAYVPPSRPLYSPRKSPPNHHHMDQMPVRDLIDNQIKQGEQLEEKFDDLLKKKRDLESRINRIPTRGLTNADRQLLDVLEREIERVEQQISSVKLELRKMNILRTH